MPRRVAPLAISALLLGTTLIGGCAAQQPSAKVETIPQGSKEDTGTLTPLERGKARRAALDEARAMIKSWDEMNETELAKHVPANVLKRFKKNWDEYKKDGLKVQRKRDVEYLDVTEMNRAGNQVTVTFAFDDDSVLVDSSGKVARKLPAANAVDATLTMQQNDKGEWEIIRMFMKEAAYR